MSDAWAEIEDRIDRLVSLLEYAQELQNHSHELASSDVDQRSNELVFAEYGCGGEIAAQFPAIDLILEIESLYEDVARAEESPLLRNRFTHPHVVSVLDARNEYRRCAVAVRRLGEAIEILKANCQPGSPTEYVERHIRIAATKLPSADRLNGMASRMVDIGLRLDKRVRRAVKSLDQDRRSTRIAEQNRQRIDKLEQTVTNTLHEIDKVVGRYESVGSVVEASNWSSLKERTILLISALEEYQQTGNPPSVSQAVSDQTSLRRWEHSCGFC
jgi:hypothetical protein